jgi:hypothetical protein
MTKPDQQQARQTTPRVVAPKTLVSANPPEAPAGETKANRPLRHKLTSAVVWLVIGQLFVGLMMWVAWLNDAQGIRDGGAANTVIVSVLLGLLVGGICAGDDLIGAPTPSAAADREATRNSVPSPGRHKKGYRPPPSIDTVDENVAAGLAATQRRAVAQRLRRRRGRQLAKRMAMLPVFVVATGVAVVVGVLSWADFLPDGWVVRGGPVVGALVAIGWIGVELHSMRQLWRGPMYVVRGVVADAECSAPEAKTEDMAQAAAGLEYTSITLEDPRIEVLALDGTLTQSAIGAHEDVLEAVTGDHTGGRRARLRCPRKLAAQVREHDRVVLLCLGDKRVIARIRDLVKLA